MRVMLNITPLSPRRPPCWPSHGDNTGATQRRLKLRILRTLEGHLARAKEITGAESQIARVDVARTLLTWAFMRASKQFPLFGMVIFLALGVTRCGSVAQSPDGGASGRGGAGGITGVAGTGAGSSAGSASAGSGGGPPLGYCDTDVDCVLQPTAGCCGACIAKTDHLQSGGPQCAGISCVRLPDTCECVKHQCTGTYCQPTDGDSCAACPGDSWHISCATCACAPIDAGVDAP
jgi:hypothetical protein